jgi:hypothetical protein
VIDPGAGSGRFLVEAARRFPAASLIAIEQDPLAALLLRANLSVLNLSHRASILVADYRVADLPPTDGKTLFIGNPPYVRHHHIEPRWKSWFAETASSFGLRASKLAGLHVYFFLRTLQLARPGDFGAFVTSAEWLDVNYGALLRRLFANGLGGLALHIIDPKALPFGQTLTSAVIACFEVGTRNSSLRVRGVRSPEELGSLSGGRRVAWMQVERQQRWSGLLRPARRPPSGYVELGELFRVHRGQVTGANDVWIQGIHSCGIPSRFLVPSVTRARDLSECGPDLSDAARLRRVIDLPPSLDEIGPEERSAVEGFLVWAKRAGAADSYIARHRRAWWSVSLYPAAPVLSTYMARNPPTFVRNICGARHINIAHGLYPRVDLGDESLLALVRWLRTRVKVESGRTYAGGLTKFEPRELEKLHVPGPGLLAEFPHSTQV